MPRFAILTHDHPAPHWDLFLEAGGILRSWRLATTLAPDVEAHIEPMADHRLHYLDYEGPISGGRGTVSRIDSGTFTWEQDEPHSVVVQLNGTRFSGRLVLRQSSGRWTARFGNG